MFGKIDASLDKKIKNVEWGEYRIGDLFDVKISFSFDEGKLDLITSREINSVEFVGRTAQNNGVKGYVKMLNVKPNSKDTISISQVGTIVAQMRCSEWYASQNIFVLAPLNNNTKLISLFVISSINRMLKGKYSQGYSNYPTLDKLRDDTIKLPTKNGKIDFDFMESFIADLEAQRIADLEAQRIADLESYLSITGLKDYELTEKEEKVIQEFQLGKIIFDNFTIQSLFNHIKQGKRLKKDDQVKGNLPFVMSGVGNTGIVGYVSNSVEVFPKNSITIDIFGNVFYRDYLFGAGDDTGVYWNDNECYSKKTMLFLTSSISRALYGKYSYGKKLRSSQSKNIKVTLPVKNNELDFEFMELFISAIQKLVIKDVVDYADNKIYATKQVIDKK